MSRTIAILCLLLSAALPFRPVPPAGAAEDGPGQPDQERLRGEVARLVEQLDHDRFEVRRRAANRLEALVARPELGRLLAAEFRRALERPEVSFEVRWHLERWSRRLPVVPLEPARQVSAEEIERLVGQLDDDSYAVRLRAHRRLESLLFTDENLAAVQKALRARLADEPDAETTARVNRLLDLARPALVAECWQGRRHVGEQHLLVGVPSLAPGAPAPSHFDRIDDRVAHCVSGSNLPPGDYPVGVAIAHPKQPTAFFHLVNLSTPRRRAEYQQHLKTDEAERLRGISRRTLKPIVAQRRKLTEGELVMLAQLDPNEVSRFAGEYFNLVDDGPLPAAQPPLAPLVRRRAGGRPSRFGVLCAQLAVDGTKEAIPGLLRAIEKGRFLPPSPAAPYRLHWLAALSIAARDPWPEVERWLGGLIGRDDRLVEGLAQSPQLGATAAAVLLRRRGHSPSAFDLQRTTARFPAPSFEGYRFRSVAARQKVHRWWQQEQEKRKQL